jgi:hypothetical protein
MSILDEAHLDDISDNGELTNFADATPKLRVDIAGSINSSTLMDNGMTVSNWESEMIYQVRKKYRVLINRSSVRHYMSGREGFKTLLSKYETKNTMRELIEEFAGENV